MKHIENIKKAIRVTLLSWWTLLVLASTASAQLTDQTQTPNTAGRGIALSLEQQIGDGQGDIFTPNTSQYIIRRDPARAIRRGRQIFQRKFTRAQGHGPRTNDGIGGPIGSPTSIESIGALGAGLGDSCATCHGIPRGSAGFGGDVVTRPDGRNAPSSVRFGTSGTTRRRNHKRSSCHSRPGGKPTQPRLKRTSPADWSAREPGMAESPPIPTERWIPPGLKGWIPICALSLSSLEGGTISMREFIVGALNAEMGMQSPDPLPGHCFRRWTVYNSGRNGTGRQQGHDRSASRQPLLRRTVTAMAWSMKSIPQSSTLWSFICSTTSNRGPGKKQMKPEKVSSI